MSTRTGKLSISGTESRINGTLLARCNELNPTAAATSFLENLGFEDGDNITVTGQDSTLGGVAVFCIESASAARSALIAARVAGVPSRRKAARRGKKTAKKSTAAKKKTGSRNASRKPRKKKARR